MAPKKSSNKKIKIIIMTIMLTTKKQRVNGVAHNTQRPHSRRNSVDAIYWSTCSTARL